MVVDVVGVEEDLDSRNGADLMEAPEVIMGEVEGSSPTTLLFHRTNVD